MAKDLLDSEDSGHEDGGTELQQGPEFKVNAEYARKFTHNKKREELQHLEEKLNGESLKRKRPNQEDEASAVSDEDSTDSEDEDDQGELATETLDSEILATLNAIRSKDPRVYDKKTTFYTQIDDDPTTHGSDTVSVGKEKPMFLRDYHRQNLLNEVDTEARDDHEPPLTYNEGQDALKRTIIKEFHAGIDGDLRAPSHSNEDDEDAEDFLVKRPKKTSKVKKTAQLDVENADRDPEQFLSNFMASRAWIPNEKPQLQPFESDDEDDDQKAEEFEEAYNFRFEDPSKSNEKLVSHARDLATKYSVRREELNPRKKRRQAKHEKREADKQELAQEKARLRKLKIEEAEQKLRKIKRAAGLGRDAELAPEELAHFLDEDWDNLKWEEEMQKRFGASYYAEEDAGNEEDEGSGSKKSKKTGKPRWDDDIDITDLIPEFDEEPPTFQPGEDSEGETPTIAIPDTDPQTNLDVKKGKRHQDKKREARKVRKMVEDVVDEQLHLEPSLHQTKSKSSRFRYRESSPLSFGLSSRDILMADDRHLNQFAGLKKLASFRDPRKRQQDQKLLGKKARLRQWRKDTFGDETGAKAVEKSDSAVAVTGESTESPRGDKQHSPPIDRPKKRKRLKKRDLEEAETV